MLIAGLAISLITYIALQYIGRFIPGFEPAKYVAAWNRFDGQLLNSFHRTISEGGKMGLYMQLHLVDFVFMTATGCWTFALLLILARKFPEESKLRKIALTMTILGLSIWLFDFIETIMVTISFLSPLDVPNWIIMAHPIPFYLAVLSYLIFFIYLPILLTVHLILFIRKKVDKG